VEPGSSGAISGNIGSSTAGLGSGPRTSAVCALDGQVEHGWSCFARVSFDPPPEGPPIVGLTCVKYKDQN
jgi:hypothetical protein